jgi:hypothetical protein
LSGDFGVAKDFWQRCVGSLNNGTLQHKNHHQKKSLHFFLSLTA